MRIDKEGFELEMQILQWGRASVSEMGMEGHERMLMLMEDWGESLGRIQD